MSREAEYYHDPNAPTPNSLAPVAFAVVRNHTGQVLLVRRADTGNWELPGGTVEYGESVVDAVIREVAEETSVTITVATLAGVYTDPGHITRYASGAVRQQFALCFHATPVDGEPRPDGTETINAAWVAQEDLEEPPIHRACGCACPTHCTNPTASTSSDRHPS